MTVTPEEKEAAWKAFERAQLRMERAQLRMERARRILNGTIVPAFRGLPNVMARDASGKWWPNSNFVQEK